MSIAVKARIIGMDPLVRKLRVIPDKTRAKMRVALAEQADEIVGLMKRLVQVDEGDLRDSIGWTWGTKVPKGAMAIATRGKGDLSITIFAGNEKAYYARWIEFGTGRHEIPHAPAHVAKMLKDGVHPGSKAFPFFYPGWRAGRKAAKAAIRKAMREAIREMGPSSGSGVVRGTKRRK